MQNRSRIKMASFTAGGIASGIISAGLSEIVLWAFQPSFSVNYLPMVLDQVGVCIIFSCFYLFNFPMRLFDSKSVKRRILQHLAFINTTVAGYLGNLFVLTQLPPECNALPILFWFSFGLIFFYAASASLLDIATYGLLYLISLVYLIYEKSDFGFDEKILFISIIFQMICFSPLAAMANQKIRALKHAFRQLEKVFYPHQLRMIKSGHELERTMPTHTAEACVIFLDIISSSKLNHIRTKEALQGFFQECSKEMMLGYDGINLKASGYRVKEPGDGLLCSVGYPFQAPSENIAECAISLARSFHRILQKEMAVLELDQPIRCGIGIALDEVTGFYPHSGTKEYDLHGRGILLANRYQSIRNLFAPHEDSVSYIILHERVYNSLSRQSRQEFKKMMLADLNYAIRDDAAARCFYMQRLEPGLQALPHLNQAV
jgi:class 3 adenylate cyclase